MRFDDASFDAAVCTLVFDLLPPPEIEQLVAEMKRVTRPGGVVATAIHAFFAGMPAFDLVLNTAAVLDSGCATLRAARAGRPYLWANAHAALWWRMGLGDVTEMPMVVDCAYPSFADYWASVTGSPGSIAAPLMAASEEVRSAIEKHVRAGYLAGLPDGPRCFPMMFRMVRGMVPA